jgi:hypothetical protein
MDDTTSVESNGNTYFANLTEDTSTDSILNADERDWILEYQLKPLLNGGKSFDQL